MMKNLNILLLFVIVPSIISLSACSEKKATHVLNAPDDSELVMASSIPLNSESQDVPDTTRFSNVSPTVKKHISNLVKNYSDIKNALVESDFDKSKAMSKNLISEINRFNGIKDLPKDQDLKYLKVGAKLKNNAERVEKSKTIKEQREHFSNLTADLYKMVQAFGGNEQEIYYQYCPMAFNNTGGYWLSLNKEIRNPYFGDKMLKCGVVKETLK